MRPLSYSICDFVPPKFPDTMKLIGLIDFGGKMIMLTLKICRNCLRLTILNIEFRPCID